MLTSRGANSELISLQVSHVGDGFSVLHSETYFIGNEKSLAIPTFHKIAYLVVVKRVHPIRWPMAQEDGIWNVKKNICKNQYSLLVKMGYCTSLPISFILEQNFSEIFALCGKMRQLRMINTCEIFSVYRTCKSVKMKYQEYVLRFTDS